jgi:cell division septation protein DedD
MPHRSVSKTVDHPRSIDQLLDSQASLEKARVDRAKAEKARADHLKAEGVPASESRPGPSAAGGSVLIQIGAFSTERLADQEWSRAAALAPGPMAGKGKRVVPVSKGGETLFRTSITGFASRDQALALCDRLQAAGGHCFVH